MTQQAVIHFMSDPSKTYTYLTQLKGLVGDDLVLVETRFGYSVAVFDHYNGEVTRRKGKFILLKIDKEAFWAEKERAELE